MSLISQQIFRGAALYAPRITPESLLMLPPLVIGAQWVCSILCLASSAILAFVRFTMHPGVDDLCQGGPLFGCLVCFMCFVLLQARGQVSHHLLHTMIFLVGGWSILYGTACLASLHATQQISIASLVVSTYALVLPIFTIRYCWLMWQQFCTFLNAHALDRRHTATHCLHLSMRLSDARIFVSYSLIPASVCLMALNAGGIYI